MQSITNDNYRVIAACDVALDVLDGCEPDPVDVCQVSAANLTYGVEVCEGAGLTDAGFDACLYDYCAFGGDEQWGNISRLTDEIGAELSPSKKKALHAIKEKEQVAEEEKADQELKQAEQELEKVEREEEVNPNMKCVDASGAAVWCSSIDAVVPDEEEE